MYRGNRDRGHSGGRAGGFSGGYGGGFGPTTAPVKVGEELDVTIEAVGEKGDGIAKKNGFVLFVPGVKQGDNVRIRITKVLRKVGFAEVVGSGSAPAEETADGQEEQPQAEELTEEAPTEDTENFGEEEQQ